ncbi:DUF5753 domain-containing protein [Actinoplanes sp. NPDC051494]|uniref:DUF5753 domain-containing protein n=1 Tax=Actinoplanes sp. NPDC051494 TaxID=3363907 RepID=UPI0037904C73
MVVPNWVSGPYAQLLTLEREATQILQRQPFFVPGVLQTERYAAAVVGETTGLAAGDPELGKRVALRMRRRAGFQARLEGERPPALAVVLHEAALRRPAVAPATIREQVEHLLEVIAGYPSVRIAMVSAEGPGAGGTFEVFVRDGVPQAAFREDADGDRLVTDPAEAGRLRADVEALLASAEASEKASQWLERIAAGL